MSAETDRLDAGCTAREVRIPVGSSTLDGELVVPAEPEGLVLFAHCSGSDPRARNQLVAQRFHQAGLGTLLFDLLTSEEAAEDNARSHLRFNIGLLTQRLVAAAHWVADEDEARHLRLGFIGVGTGAAAALVAAADLGRPIGAIVCRGGRPDLAGNALRRVKAPTLLMVGGLDEAAIEFNEDAYEMLDCEKTLTIIPAASHLFEEPGTLEEVSHLAADWFLERLRPFSSARFTR